MFESRAAEDLAVAGEVGVKHDSPCLICGDRNYSWGGLYAHGISFIPDDSSWLSKIWRSGTKLRARRCESCGNVQTFA